MIASIVAFVQVRKEQRILAARRPNDSDDVEQATPSDGEGVSTADETRGMVSEIL